MPVMDAVFHVIDKTTWERAIYFDYYYHQIKCKYNLTVNIDITRLMKRKKERNLKFFPMMLYAIMKAVNQNKEFRMSFNEQGELGYWDEVVPSYTLFMRRTRPLRMCGAPIMPILIPFMRPSFRI